MTRPRCTRGPAALALAILASLLTADAASAQCLPPLLPPEEQEPCELHYPSWTAELTALGANALLGGISGGIMHRVHGGSFSDGFLGGLAGGAVIYGGKRVAVERFGGAGLVGRQVAAVGASMVRNSGEGRGTLERVVLPVGPFRLQLQNAAPRVRVRADAFAIGWTIAGLIDSELHLDFGRSLSAGAPVFRTDNRIILTGGDSAHASGIAKPGVLYIADVPAYGREYARRTFEHERVHLLQLDQIFMTVTDPIEDELIGRVPGLRRIEPWVDINLSGQLIEMIGGWIPKHLDRPWETEAIYFSR